jgi:hypothetical protein
MDCCLHSATMIRQMHHLVPLVCSLVSEATLLSLLLQSLSCWEPLRRSAAAGGCTTHSW